VIGLKEKKIKIILSCSGKNKVRFVSQEDFKKLKRRGWRLDGVYRDNQKEKQDF
jgi:hypothetical protein